MCSNAMSYGFSIHKLRGISRSSVINTGLRPTKAPSERWVFSASSAKRSKYSPRREKASTLFLEVEEDGSDAWKLDPVIDMLEGGLVRYQVKLNDHRYTFSFWISDWAN